MIMGWWWWKGPLRYDDLCLEITQTLLHLLRPLCRCSLSPVSVSFQITVSGGPSFNWGVTSSRITLVREEIKLSLNSTKWTILERLKQEKKILSLCIRRWLMIMMIILLSSNTHANTYPRKQLCSVSYRIRVHWRKKKIGVYQRDSNFDCVATPWSTTLIRF